MQRSHIVDTATHPWRDSASGGVSYACQVLLDGADGAPEALRFRFRDSPSVYAHMHLTAQFQLLLNGAMDFPRGVKHLEGLAIHYTDHNMPYGPFAVSGGHEMLVLHPKAGGIIPMSNHDARRKINLTGRLYATEAAGWDWQALPDLPGARAKPLMPEGFGPSAWLVQLPPGAQLPVQPAEHGRYEVVVEGCALIEGQSILRPGFRYVCGPDTPAPLVAGDEGATLALLSFDHDALEGGLTGEGLSREAEEAMARAI
jgi:hypothetical protein